MNDQVEVVKNPVGKAVTAALNTTMANCTPPIHIKVDSYPSPWGSTEYNASNVTRTRRIWINDYKDQTFIEIRVGLFDVSPAHHQKFHYSITDAARIISEMTEFFNEGKLPAFSPAKKQYVAWLNTPDSAVRKEQLTASKAAKEAIAALPVVAPESSTVPAWKNALNSLINLGTSTRNSRRNSK